MLDDVKTNRIEKKFDKTVVKVNNVKTNGTYVLRDHVDRWKKEKAECKAAEMQVQRA